MTKKDEIIILSSMNAIGEVEGEEKWNSVPDRIPLVVTNLKIKIEDANSYLGDAVMMADITTEFLKKDPDLFIDRKTIPKVCYS